MSVCVCAIVFDVHDRGAVPRTGRQSAEYPTGACQDPLRQHKRACASSEHRLPQIIILTRSQAVCVCVHVVCVDSAYTDERIVLKQKIKIIVYNPLSSR